MVLLKQNDFKDIPVIIRDIHKIENKNSIKIRVFGYENKGTYPIYVSKKSCEKKYVDLLLIREEEKSTMFLLMILIDSCIIIHDIAEENIFVIVAYMLSLQKKY